MATGRTDFEADEGLDGPKADKVKPLICRPDAAVDIGTAYAMQVTRHSRVAVLCWLRDKARMARGGVMVFLEQGPRVVYDGEWVVLPQGGSPFVLPEELFTKIYKTTKAKR